MVEGSRGLIVSSLLRFRRMAPSLVTLVGEKAEFCALPKLESCARAAVQCHLVPWAWTSRGS